MSAKVKMSPYLKWRQTSSSVIIHITQVRCRHFLLVMQGAENNDQHAGLDNSLSTLSVYLFVVFFCFFFILHLQCQSRLQRAL